MRFSLDNRFFAPRFLSLSLSLSPTTTTPPPARQCALSVFGFFFLSFFDEPVQSAPRAQALCDTLRVDPADAAARVDDNVADNDDDDDDDDVADDDDDDDDDVGVGGEAGDDDDDDADDDAAASFASAAADVAIRVILSSALSSASRQWRFVIPLIFESG